jgi:hypothetical protein
LVRARIMLRSIDWAVGPLQIYGKSRDWLPLIYTLPADGRREGPAEDASKDEQFRDVPCRDPEESNRDLAALLADGHEIESCQVAGDSAGGHP